MFDISVKQTALGKALSYLEATVGKNANNLGDNCISMSLKSIKGKVGKLEMYTTNTNEVTSLELEVTVLDPKTKVAPYVDFKRLNKVILSIPPDETIRLKEKTNCIELSWSLSKKVKLVGNTIGMLPLPEIDKAIDTAIIPKEFIQRTILNASSIIEDSISLPIFNCVRYHTVNQDIECTAMDVNNKRMFMQKDSIQSINNKDTEILIECSKLKKSLSIFEDYNKIEFKMDNNITMLRGTDIVSNMTQKTNGVIDNIRYYARRLNGNFPSTIKATIEVTPKEFITFNKKDFIDCFSRVKAIEDKSIGTDIKITLDKTEAEIEYTSSNGQIDEIINTQKQIRFPFKTRIKYRELNDILKILDGVQFQIGLLPNTNNYYVVRENNNNNLLFTITSIYSPLKV